MRLKQHTGNKIRRTLWRRVAHTGDIGAWGEALATAYLIEHGYEVFRAACHQASCDLIALKQPIALRVEVKTHRAHGTREGRYDLLIEVLSPSEITCYDSLGKKMLQPPWRSGMMVHP